ncbi:tetratricopeptide repeat protein [Aurantivibrio plasticivorans]
MCILNSRYSVLVVWFGVLLLATFVYWPGLQGPFLFDDYGSLSRLGDLGGIRNWESFKAFVFGGGAGPTGRPISLLSFLIDGSSWPTEAWPFKRTNLLIHLANGSLVAVISVQLLRVLSLPTNLPVRAYWLAIVAAALWLLHPFLVSTTLYIVQRMAQLSALFCFLGVAGYLWGRQLALESRVRGYLLMSFSVGANTLLAVLSKENGAVLPLMLWLIEITLISSKRSVFGSLNKLWYLVFLMLPSLLVVGYLVKIGFGGAFFVENSARGFSPYERLLTQTRILFEYLYHWFVPKLYTSGLYQDNYPKSISLLSPWTTTVAVLAHIIVIATMTLKRKEWPLFAFSVLFFYVSHLIESSVVLLELYFEHRNYLATAFLFLPLCYLAFNHFSRVWAAISSVFGVVILASFCYFSAVVWSNYPSLALSWAQKAPMSSRAQQQAAQVLFDLGQHEKAMATLERAIDRIPNDMTLRMWKIIYSCRYTQMNSLDLLALQKLSKNSIYDLRAFNLYQLFVDEAAQGKCNGLSLDEVKVVLHGLMALPANANPKSGRFSQLQYLNGRLAVYQAEPDFALKYFKSSLRARSGPGKAMNMAAFLASKQYYLEAMILSDIAMSYVEDGNVGSTNRDRDTLGKDIAVFQEILRTQMQE